MNYTRNNPRLSTFCYLLYALVSAATATNAEDAPRLLRLAVIDDSGSMAGERIASVRDELTKVARQLPPSASHPIVLVKFGSTAAPPVTFTDLATFEAAVALLKGSSGGTSIAAGLTAAVEQLDRLRSAQDVWVLLYTDGNDSDQAGIAKAEASLDSVFADRQELQLPQTVFCKRWGNANAELLSQIRKRGRATVLDAGQLNVRPLTFTPVIEATSIEWDRSDANQLNITYSARVDVKGDVDGLTLPALTAKCTLAGTMGDVETDVTPAGPVIAGRTIRLQISPADRRAGQLRLPFTCTPPADISTADSKVLPQLSASSLDVPIKLPPDKYTFRISSELKPEPGVWVDTATRRVRYAAKLKLLVTCKEGIEGPPGDVELVPEQGTILISGPPVLKLPGAGAVEADYVIETTVQHAHEARDQWRCSFGFEGKPVNTPPNMTFEPPVWTLHADAAVPSPVTTTVTGKVVHVSTPAWINLANGTATFDVDTELDVQGPIAAKTVLNLLTTGSVVNLKLDPNVLRTGKQRVRLSLIAALRPSPHSVAFESSILAPRGDGVIVYQSGPPLKYSVTGPTTAALALARSGRQLKELQVSISDNENRLRLPVEPVVVGYHGSPLLGDLNVTLKPQAAALQFAAPGTYRVDRQHQLEVSVTAPGERPFFRDIALIGSINVDPASSNSAVISATVPVRVIVAAPFKRLALYLAVGLSVLLTGIVLVRLFLALRRTD